MVVPESFCSASHDLVVSKACSIVVEESELV